MLLFVSLLAVAVFGTTLYFYRGLWKKYLPGHRAVRTSPPAFSDDNFSVPAQDAVDELAMEIDDLHWLLTNKKAGLQQLKSEQVLHGETVMKLDAIEDTIDTIETRLHKLQANIANVRQAAVTMDELGVALRQAQGSLSQSQQLLHLAQSENKDLQQQLDELRDYAADLKEQRQLLQKKIRMLESLHSPS